MKNSFVRGFEPGDDEDLIMSEGQIGFDDKPFHNQPPLYKDIPIVCCSYICDGYQDCYSDKGVLFETDTPIVYAMPDDSFSLMRSGVWIPGYEKFLFTTLEEMLDRYPSPLSFHNDLKKLFEELGPKEMYPDLREFNQESAKERYESDLYRRPNTNFGYNEIAFQKPLKITNTVCFDSKQEMIKILLS